MSYYTAICMRCPTKRFIVPGTETDKARHEGSDGPDLDAIHTPLPLALKERRAQLWMLVGAFEIIKERAPMAVYLDLETSDQGRYGFVMTGLRSALDGPDLLPDWGDADHPLAPLLDEVADQISDLDWDGVVGEDEHGYVTWDLVANKVVEVAA